MKLGELLEKINMIEAAADFGIEVSGVCYDTRKLKTGDLFVAIRGYEHDGHDYIDNAISSGAVCVICENAKDASVPYVLVKDSRKALAEISASWFGFPASKLSIIGVTGTNGKTTVTSLIKQVIETCSGGIAGLIGTNGILIGEKEYGTERTTPESYELHECLAKMVNEGCRYVVMEVSSHALCLHRVYGIEFEVGVYTNLSRDHMDFHSSMDEYASQKAILFLSSRNSVINIDDEYAPIMLRSSAGPVYTYSVDNDAADFVAKNIRLQAEKADFCVLTVGSLERIELRIPGMFSVYNALAVVTAVKVLGYDIPQISAALQNCGGVKGRAEVVPIGRDFTVLIDYAHTPDALSNIITAARSFTQGRVVTLFGCGGDRDKTKRPQMGAIAAELSDFIIVTSDNPRTEVPGEIIKEILAGMEGTKKPYRVIENRREAIYWALESSLPHDVLILAGKGHETYQIIGKEKFHFDEREVVAEYFSM